MEESSLSDTVSMNSLLLIFFSEPCSVGTKKLNNDTINFITLTYIYLNSDKNKLEYLLFLRFLVAARGMMMIGWVWFGLVPQLKISKQMINFATNHMPFIQK